jgi:hypothetical protein
MRILYLFHARGRPWSKVAAVPDGPARQSPWFRSVGTSAVDSFSWWTDASARKLPQHTLFVIAVAALVKPTGACMARVIFHQRPRWSCALKRGVESRG